MSRDLAYNVIEDIKEQVKAGKVNGDIDRMTLILITDVHTHVEELSANPMIIIGRLLKKYPAITWPALLIGWVMVGGAAAIAVIIALESLGLYIGQMP